MRLMGATVIVATSMAFAACGSAKQAPSPVAEDDAGPEFVPPDGGRFGGDDGSPTGTCEHTVALDIPMPEAGAPQPFDVILVADNADGLTYSMSSLASGLKNLLAGVAGQSARFFLLSTTQYGASSKGAVSQTSGQNLVSWSSTVTGAADADPVTTYSQQCTDGTGASIACPASFTGLGAYAVHGTWAFTMPPPIATITPSMTAAQIAAQGQTIASAILNSSNAGSDEEQPICTLNRYIRQPPAALPKRAVFIVISDEDDTTPAGDCLATYDFKTMPETPTTQESCSSNCQSYDFQAMGTTNYPGLAYSCVPIDDKGVTYPALGKARTLDLGGLGACAAAASCTSDEQMLAANDCGTGYVAQNCAVTCTAGSTYCVLQRTTNTPDVCTQSFQEGGVTYANFADYCAKTTQLTDASQWSGCQSYGYNIVDGGSTVYSATETKTQVFPGASSTADMVGYFDSAATAAFGADGYRTETIQFDPAFSCPMGPGQSYGPTLRTLASAPADVFSICGDYSAALAGVSDFAAAIPDAYPLSLGPNDTVTGVSVVNTSGATRSLAPSDYTVDASGVLRLGAGVLTKSDASLRVTIASLSYAPDASLPPAR
jgi:hypothetical protein